MAKHTSFPPSSLYEHLHKRSHIDHLARIRVEQEWRKVVLGRETDVGRGQEAQEYDN